MMLSTGLVSFSLALFFINETCRTNMVQVIFSCLNSIRNEAQWFEMVTGIVLIELISYYMYSSSHILFPQCSCKHDNSKFKFRCNESAKNGRLLATNVYTNTRMHANIIVWKQYTASIYNSWSFNWRFSVAAPNIVETTNLWRCEQRMAIITSVDPYDYKRSQFLWRYRNSYEFSFVYREVSTLVVIPYFTINNLHIFIRGHILWCAVICHDDAVCVCVSTYLPFIWKLNRTKLMYKTVVNKSKS